MIKHNKPTIGYPVNNYGLFFKSMVLIHRPKWIVEIGIGEGFTLKYLFAGVKENGYGKIKAYDLFEKWPYFHKANYAILKRRFPKVELFHGNFNEIYRRLEDESIDLFNIDLPMDGDAYRFFFKYYLKKMTKNGIAILEGGSAERDNLHWMKRYNRAPISPVIEELKAKVNIFTINPFPSLTLIRRK
jgi:predicted O-methyltransferase YrrM